jgi:hypothetical protein
MGAQRWRDPATDPWYAIWLVVDHEDVIVLDSVRLRD